MTKISLCMVVRNEGKRLPKLFGICKEFVSQIVVFDQDSDDNTVDVCREHNAYIHKTTRKSLADSDRQDCYNIATGDMVLALDGDEYPDTKLRNLLKGIKEGKPEYDVYWFKFLNLVNGVDIKEVLGDDWHPRLWVRNDTRPPVVIWPDKAHTFPQINTQNVIFWERGKIVHDRLFKNIKATHENRVKVIDPQNQDVERNFINAVSSILDRKGVRH